jgi:hypothetical protein
MYFHRFKDIVYNVGPMATKPTILSLCIVLHVTIIPLYNLTCFLCLFSFGVFFFFELHEQFFSCLATVTITGDRAANLDLFLALTAFSSEGSFTCHIYCEKGPSFLRSCPKEPRYSLLNAVLLAKEQSVPILNVLG